APTAPLRASRSVHRLAVIERLALSFDTSTSSVHRLAVIERLALSFDYAQLSRRRSESRFNYRAVVVSRDSVTTCPPAISICFLKCLTAY
ncbi:hypothetical protein, partial [Nostoc sp. DedQUE02]|uniref:hypothetical protein n=1 Tax=Nostoc sp. DedQUE02 TaxID=3075388 RepID=UPI003919F546